VHGLGDHHVGDLEKIGLGTIQCSFAFHEVYKAHNKIKATLKE
jgi:hypothetical protein